MFVLTEFVVAIKLRFEVDELYNMRCEFSVLVAYQVSYTWFFIIEPTTVGSFSSLL